MIMLGSMPRTVQDEESRVRVDGREGQSPIRWRLLVQWAQERETRTGSESGRVVVSFHIRSQSSSMCVVEPHSSQGNSLEEPFSADGQLSSSWPRARHRWHRRQVGQKLLWCWFQAPQCMHYMVGWLVGGGDDGEGVSVTSRDGQTSARWPSSRHSVQAMGSWRSMALTSRS